MWTNLIKQSPAAKATTDRKFRAVFSQRKATRLNRLSLPMSQISSNSTNIAISYLNITTEPTRLSGTIILVQDTFNAIEPPRQAWHHNPGTRRVLRAPELACDNPLFNIDGQATCDQFDHAFAVDRTSYFFCKKCPFAATICKHSYADVTFSLAQAGAGNSGVRLTREKVA